MSELVILRPSVEDRLVDGLREAITRQAQSNSLLTWLRLASGDMTEDDYYTLLTARDEITYLTLDTTGSCDLHCPGMCYYHPEIQAKLPQITFDKVQAAILDAQELGMSALVVGGKEPFLNPVRLFEILNYAGSIKANRFAVGLVTNGRNVQRHWDNLRQTVAAGSLDFMDVSIDSGYAEQHDAIRGVPGTYSLASATVRNAARQFPSVRVGISSVIRCDNQEGLIELLRCMVPEVSNFCFQPIQPPPFSTTLPVRSSEVTSFLSRVGALLTTELADAAIEVMVVLHGPYVSGAVAAGLFDWKDLEENSEGQIFAKRTLGSSTIYYNLMVLPDYGWKQARINYRGDYLSHAHFLQTPDPSKFAIGNIQSERLPNLLRKAKERDQLAFRLLESRIHHECRERHCWTSCFGGWTISENDFLKGRSLNLQPSMCLKTPDDF